LACSFDLYLSAAYHFSFGIKRPKSKPAKATRPKLPGRIEQLAVKDIEAAIGLARMGVQLTHVQTLLKRYYVAKADCEAVQSGKMGSFWKVMEETSGKVWTQGDIDSLNSYMPKYTAGQLEELCQIFKTSVATGDSKKIIEIGKGIEFLRTIATDDPKSQGDHFRADILKWKDFLDKRGEKWPIRKLAEKIGWPMEDSINGFYKLRRMAEKLNFPLDISTQISHG
jgi:hypothetical protein